MLNIGNGQSTLFASDEAVSEPNWLGDGNELLFLKSGEKSFTQLVVGDVDEVGKTYVAGIVPGPISEIKLKTLDRDRVAIALVGKANPDGSFYNPDDQPKRHSSGMLYDSLMVRHWDKYVASNKNAIWHGILQKAKPHASDLKGRYSLGNLTNILKGSRLESPIPPFGGQDNFDLGLNKIIFVAKDPELNPATNTNCNFYHVEIDTLNPHHAYSKPMKVETQHLKGASSSPVLSPNGKGAAWLQMKENGYESDKNRIIHVPDLSKPLAGIELLESDDGKGMWDKSPSSITWSNDGRTLFLIAEDEGTSRLFKIDIGQDGIGTRELPTPLTPRAGFIGDVQSLGTDTSDLFLSGSNLVDNSVYTILDPTSSKEARIVSSNSHNGSFFGLSQNQVADLWFDSNGHQVHALVIKPSNFDSKTKYPLAYLVHGGPQGAWVDQVRNF